MAPLLLGRGVHVLPPCMLTPCCHIQNFPEFTFDPTGGLQLCVLVFSFSRFSIGKKREAGKPAAVPCAVPQCCWALAKGKIIPAAGWLVPVCPHA